MKVTAEDIANRLGTSKASVSRAFKPDSPLSKALRSQILQTAHEMGYVPPGRRPSGRGDNLAISLVVGDIRNPYFASVLEEFSKAAAEQNIELLFHAVPNGLTVDSIMSQVFRDGSDGAIITSATLNSDLARQCRNRGLPVVLFGRVQVDAQLSAVSGDNYNGARLVARRFIDQGRRRIAFLGGIANASTHLERRRGFLDAMEEAGMQPAGDWSGGFQYDQAHAAVSSALAAPSRPDAIFCANDIMAVAAIDAAKKAGIRPGSDLGIIGYDDIPMAAWESYKLTTVRQRIRLMVGNALSMMAELIDDPGALGTIKITPCYLVERSSG